MPFDTMNKMVNMKIFIPKDQNPSKTIELDNSIILNNCSKIFVNAVNIFWNYDNLSKNTHNYIYDVGGANSKVILQDGYHTFINLKTEFENQGNIELEKVDYNGKCTIKSDKQMNLKTLGPILGFTENKIISANTLTESNNIVNINNGLEYVNISCNLIDKSKNFVNGKRSDILVQIPITTQQTLKGSVTRIYPPEETKGINLSNGIYNEITFKIQGNNSKSVGNVLLDIVIK